MTDAADFGRIDTGAHLYLDLLKRCLLNLIHEDPPIGCGLGASSGDAGGQNNRLPSGFDLHMRLEGKDWPSQAHTMIGWKRLDNIQSLITSILRDRIPGDLIETGVWRGGSTVFMRGVLKAYGILDRTVWVADVFEGLPMPGDGAFSPHTWSSPELNLKPGQLDRARHAGKLTALLEARRDAPDVYRKLMEQFNRGTSVEEVRNLFARYGLLDEQVRFLRGWFRETLPSAPIGSLALLRLDGDLYDSTYDALSALYPRVSHGGYVIIDDYNAFTECRQAVQDYLGETRTQVEIQPIDDEAVYWRLTT